MLLSEVVPQLFAGGRVAAAAGGRAGNVPLFDLRRCQAAGASAPAAANIVMCVMYSHGLSWVQSPDALTETWDARIVAVKHCEIRAWYQHYLWVGVYPMLPWPSAPPVL